jgi:hypothetical protein
MLFKNLWVEIIIQNKKKKKKKSKMSLKLMVNGNEEAVEYLKNHTYSISGNRKVMVKFHISLMISLWNISQIRQFKWKKYIYISKINFWSSCRNFLLAPLRILSYVPTASLKIFSTTQFSGFFLVIMVSKIFRKNFNFNIIFYRFFSWPVWILYIYIYIYIYIYDQLN